jgi:hypothetical protein
MRDCVAKGRNVGGERNKGGGKLSTDQVRAILKATGLHREIAKTFGVSRGMISHIKRRDAWKCVKEL